MNKAQIMAKRIELILLDRGISPRKVKSKIAEICDISIQAVYQWFNGKTQQIEHEHIVKIGNYLSLTIEQVTGEEAMPLTSDSRRSVNQIVDTLDENQMSSLLVLLNEFYVKKKS